MSQSEPQDSNAKDSNAKGDEEAEEEEEEDGEAEEEGSEEAESGDEEDNEDEDSDAPESPKLMEDQDGADTEFWNQEFFAEEGRDDEYATESESEDKADTDFSGSEEDDDEEGGDGAEAKERRKTLKPPGTKRPRPPTHAAGSAAEGVAGAGKESLLPGEAAAAKAAARAAKLAVRQARLEAAAGQAPTLRKSTRERIEEAERERQLLQQRKPRKRRAEAEVRALTQEELLAEAAETELVNTASLARLIAVEEEVKARADGNKKAGYTGPLLRYHSRRVGEGAELRCEARLPGRPQYKSRTVFEIVNMLSPPELQAQCAPPSAPRAPCAVTGLPAKYRDPLTGAAYATAAAFRALRQCRADAHLAHGLSAAGMQRPMASGAPPGPHKRPAALWGHAAYPGATPAAPAASRGWHGAAGGGGGAAAPAPAEWASGLPVARFSMHPAPVAPAAVGGAAAGRAAGGGWGAPGPPGAAGAAGAARALAGAAGAAPHRPDGGGVVLPYPGHLMPGAAAVAPAQPAPAAAAPAAPMPAARPAGAPAGAGLAAPWPRPSGAQQALPVQGAAAAHLVPGAHRAGGREQGQGPGLTESAIMDVDVGAFLAASP